MRDPRSKGMAGGLKRSDSDSPVEVDERLRKIDPKMVEMIQNEIMDTGSNIAWEDIAGLQHAKKSIQEMVIWPMLRPFVLLLLSDH